MIIKRNKELRIVEMVTNNEIRTNHLFCEIIDCKVVVKVTPRVLIVCSLS